MALKTQNFLIILLAVSLIVLTSGIFNISQKSFATKQIAPVVGSMKEYKNDGLAYSMLYPSNWIKHNEKSEHVSFESPNLHPNSTNYQTPNSYVDVSNTTAALLLPFMVDNKIKSVSNEFQNVEVSKKIPFTSGGNTGYELVYSYKDPDFGKLKVMRILMVGGHKYYDVGFKSETKEFNQYLPTAEAMLSSFDVTGQERLVHQVNSACTALNTAVPFVNLAPHPAIKVVAAALTAASILECSK